MKGATMTRHAPAIAASADLRDSFLQAMGRVACTVNIVATDGPAGRSGATVSAMASVSADGEAPTLLVCLHRESATAQAITANRAFSVNILRDSQAYVSDGFAGRVPAFRNDKFACADWSAGATGAPLLGGALVSFDCRVLSAQSVGTHDIFIGSVAEVVLGEPGTPLIYTDRSYARAARLPATSLPAA